MEVLSILIVEKDLRALVFSQPAIGAVWYLFDLLNAFIPSKTSIRGS